MVATPTDAAPGEGLAAPGDRPSVAIDAVHAGLSGDPEALGGLGRSEVLRALGVLTPGQRRIIMLTYWDGLAVGEVAELLRTSESRVRKTLARAEDRLRATLGLEGTGNG